MMIFLIFSLIIAVLAVVFALQNTAEVTVTFLLWTVKGSLALILLLALIAGAVASFFASLPTIIRNKWIVRSQRKKQTEMEANLTVHKQKLEEVQNQLLAQQKPAVPPQVPASTDEKLPPPPAGE